MCGEEKGLLAEDIEGEVVSWFWQTSLQYARLDSQKMMSD
jgi:hypothetical protein